MKVKEVFEKSVQFLRDRQIETPRLETELLLASVLKTDRIGIYLKYEAPLTEAEIKTLRELVVRKGKGEPTAYILGEKYFYGHCFKVGPGVLIPRPETEMIVEDIVSTLPQMSLPQGLRIVDWGAGSGCIGISLGIVIPNSEVTLIERSSRAYEYCQKNVEALMDEQGRRRVKIINQSVEAWSPHSVYQIIVANPPYIDPSDPDVSPAVRQFEPPEALFANNNGLAAIESWFHKVKEILAPGGLCYFEIGHRQGPAVKTLFEAGNIFCKVEILKDFSNRDRIIKAVKNG